MDVLQKNKQAVMVIGAIVLVAIIGVALLQLRGKPDGKMAEERENTLPEVESLPMVDSSVVVNLKPNAKNQEADLIVENLPEGTTEIQYTISYDAMVDGETVPRGVVGTLTIAADGATAQKKGIVYGTESSSVKRYDKVVGSVVVDLKFVGSYGAQLYNGTF